MTAASLTNGVLSEIGRQYLRLHATADIGPIRFRRLLGHFGSIDAVLGASSAELQRVEGIGPQLAARIRAARSNDEWLDHEAGLAGANGVRIICQAEADYPAPLLHTPDPPICLYVRGRWEPADSLALAIVGTRRASHYGREQAIRFAQLLGRAGFTIVSGMARGIDGHAHRGALDAGARTLAVLGNGLSHIYPPEHESLAAEIERNGAVFSELPMETAPEAGNFPRRNRIIAGLCLGTIVVEAGKNSGALISARLAADYGREVFAVPGRIDHPDTTAGVNALIRDGRAKLVTSLDDILDELGDVGRIMRSRPAPVSSVKQTVSEATTGANDAAPNPVVPVDRLTSLERAVYDAVSRGAEDSDAIGAETQVDVGKVTAALTALELKGFVRRLPGNRFERC
jgi:DNA processing protein